jgi:hypothetical protein
MARTRIDHRRLKRSRTYTVLEAAQALRATIGTVRRWVRQGLPLIDETRPYLIHGKVMHDWMNERAKARKVQCGPRQIFCCKCQDARDILPGSAVIIHRNETKASVRALCQVCGTKMFRHCSKASADDWLTMQRPISGQALTLIASSNPLPNDHLCGPNEKTATPFKARPPLIQPLYC